MHNRIAPVLMSFMFAVGIVNAQDKPAVKLVPLTQTSPASGKQMFVTYCAVCHGADGKGGGPAAAAMKTRPTDLTQLAANNKGNFPTIKVTATLSGKNVVAHGSEQMPVWGDLFKSLDNGQGGNAQLRVVNLTAYIQSIQGK